VVPALLRGGAAGRQGGHSRTPLHHFPEQLPKAWGSAWACSSANFSGSPKELQFAAGSFLKSQGEKEGVLFMVVFFLGVVTTPFFRWWSVYAFQEKCLIISSENTYYYLSSE